ncbi:quinohemoprotein amine dehydrogenase maturation protein [Insolitispirillum peregrinum]|uniref:quinohemoprotein amine dehydrogenase maturation protein n=1 Tax=Insolitispirillum peregrinum TaxID=80876 RepID=UPI003617A446
MTALRLKTNDVHEVHADGAHILFHIPSTSLFELDEVGGAVLSLFRDRPQVEPDDIRASFEGRFAAPEVIDTIQGLLTLGILEDAACASAPLEALVPERHPLTNLVLNVTTGCNLGCTYCYKEDLTTPMAAKTMALDDARRSVDLLLAESQDRERVSLVFFGGEPLTNMPLIRAVTDYAEQAAEAVGKGIDFSLTTNATLLTPEISSWLDAHRFGLTVSMDGYRELHDKNRKTIGGKGTYDVVARNVRDLLGRYRSRPIGARVTLTAGVVDVVGIHRHLRDELGFYEVGFAPATSTDLAMFSLDDDETGEVFRAFRFLGQEYVDAAIRGENTGFANMRTLLKTLAEGARKSVPCGAGLGLLSVDAGGKINLCHRFTGSEMGTFGDIHSGIDRTALNGFIRQAATRTSNPANGCSSCRVRHICAGGCYHESHAKFGDALHPVYHVCDSIRDWVDFGISSYARLQRENPGFLQSHVQFQTEFLQ